MSHATIVPAYGRDYKSKAAVEADLLAGKDFIFQGYAGNAGYINLEGLHQAGYSEANVRYGQLRKVMVVKVAKLYARSLEGK